VQLHTGEAYVAMAIVTPWLLLALARASDDRWGATKVASLYTALSLLGLWVMPLFPAEPKLGPVYQPITHFVPLEFPVLVLVPAIALDLLRARMPQAAAWKQALIMGPVFVLTLAAVQWPFASFLLSPASHNRVFGTHYFAYFIPPSFLAPRGLFRTEPLEATLTGLAIAMAAAALSSTVGLLAGAALRKVRR